MSSIIIATLAVAILGLLIGILLVTVDKKFKVEVDEKQVAIREFLGAGSLFGRQLLPDSVPPIAIFVKAPGAFLVIALIIAALNAFHIANHSTDLVSGCDGCCNHCSKAGCHNEHKEEKSV